MSAPPRPSTLIVLDGAADDTSEFRRQCQRLARAADSTTGEPMDVLAFVEADPADVRALVTERVEDDIRVLDAGEALATAAASVRQGLIEFVSRLRLDLVALAERTGGPRWATRFGRLWWYTKLAEKNTPLDEEWSACVRLEAVRSAIDRGRYSRILAVGARPFVECVAQLAAAAAVPHSVAVIRARRRMWWRFLAMRLSACAGLAIVILWSRWRHRTAVQPNPPMLAFSWPEFWRPRFGSWEDVYYGRPPMMSRAGNLEQPLYVLGLYGRPYLPFWFLIDQFRRLSRQPHWSAVRYVVLERSGLLRTIATYLDPRDTFRFWRMTRSKEYGETFRWLGVDVSRLFALLNWESALVRWPYLLMQEEYARRAVDGLKASTAIAYAFEYLGGRSLVAGAVAGGARVIGMQHGPMANMRLLYTGTPDELRPVGRAAAAPEPHLYVVDGPLSRDLMVARGIGPARVRVAGAARFDPVWELARRVRHRPRCSRTPVSLLVAPSLHDTTFVVDRVLRAFAGDDRVRLVIKPHPKVDHSWVAGLIGADATRTELVTDGEIYSHLASADILVGTYSSALIEAIGFGVPIILLQSSRRIDLSPFFGDSRGPLTAHNTDDLRLHMKRLIEDDAYRRTYVVQLEEVFRYVFGDTTQSAADHLAKICAEMIGQDSDAPPSVDLTSSHSTA
jgi:hypothetical protein